MPEPHLAGGYAGELIEKSWRKDQQINNGTAYSSLGNLHGIEEKLRLELKLNGLVSLEHLL